ncbi:hypothetical protein [Oceanobacillus alkalisoli]|uniref:hypothetical protein n=1 Tax=Oceanobacillus alkalisoli TaxID=2925113 RepID=UPI001EEFCA08|nr:hypothetical protein [Oceanobacillus alkalisoli]MCF3942848.1 hypothetical protein [Oceanobacillus alkalisoli]MCG5102428.1 hypothetical protein [Oceanobacillus alkalisoli]
MKKMIVALCAIALVFSPIGDFVFQDAGTTVEAKRYKSGKKSFNPSNGSINSNNNNSFFQNNKKDSTVNKSATKQNTNNKGGMMSGGLMKGLMLGGLAGLLFGGLLGNMGILGSLLGLIINGLAIVFLISIAMKIYQFFKKKKEANVWRN